MSASGVSAWVCGTFRRGGELMLLPSILAFSTLLVGVTAAPPERAGSQTPSAKLVLEGVEVEPKTAAPDVLCRLGARVRNDGAAVASGLVFRVRLDGEELVVYHHQIFLDPIEPGETRTIPLYSFWTTETHRPVPADGAIDVEVTLVEARWTKLEKDAAGTWVWSDLGMVEGLPLTTRYVLKLSS